jgi:fatty-acyl-CoA synthase
VAAGLLADASPGERVAVWAPNSTEWIVVEFAVARAGLVLVPVNPALTDGEAADLIARSGSVVVLAVPDFRGRDLLGAARGLVDRLPRLRRVLALPDLLGEFSGDGSALPDVDPDAPFLVQYTSGTTGRPKGAVLTQRAAYNVGALSVPVMGLPDGTVWLNPLPMHHVAASVAVLMSGLAVGGTIVLAAFDPALMLDLAERCRVTAVGVVPVVLTALLDHPDTPSRDLSALEVIWIGGSTVAPSLIRRAETALGARVVNSYGQSESPAATSTRPDDSDEVKALTIGRPGLHREARIVRVGTSETAAHGESGELLLRSPVNMTGYDGDPEQTADVLDADGWLHTGDLCSMTADGVLTIRGRLKDVIIRGGENVYPAEVEEVLLRHPAVAEVAVLGSPDERWGEQIAAVVRFRPARRVDWGELAAHARSGLAGFKVPRLWREVDAFPTTASGKVQKFRLAEELAEAERLPGDL